LGTILLELQIGQTLETFLGTKPAKSLDEQWGYANKIYYQKLNRGQLILSRHYRHAIEFCLKPDKVPKQPDLIRKSIYDHVVLPLEKAIAESDLNDEGFEFLDLGLIKRATISNVDPPGTRKPAQNMSKTAPLHETANVKFEVPIPQPDETFATGELEEGFDLFGEEEGVEPDKESVSCSSPI
jgi:hypothetical protein